MMRYIPAFALLFGFACVQEETPTVAVESRALIGGDLDDGHLAAVALNRFGTPVCTGTLVSPRVVLTAAHCLDMLSSDPSASIFFGNDTEQDSDGVRIAVADSHYHPEWTGDLSGQHDIGMLLMEFPADPELAIPLSHEIMSDHIGEEVIRVGFGIHNSETRAHDGKKRTGVVTVDSTPGGADYFIAGEPDIRTCQGDSGGPAFLDIGGVLHIAGVHSFGTEGCFTPHNGDTRVELYADDFVTPWIQENDPSCGEDLLCSRVGCTADPDCEPCGPDGTCVEDCPLPDVDCQTQEIGELCRADSHCISENCVVYRPEQRTRFCTTECDPASDSCPEGMSCQSILPFGNICYYDEDPPGVLGDSCEDNYDCGAYQCEEGFCVYDCDLSKNLGCPDGFECSDIGHGFTCHALPQSGGCGCSTSSNQNAWLCILVLAVLVFRRRRD